MERRLLKGAAHITGGGITDNLPRILPRGVAAEIDTSAWTVPPIFEHLREIGNVPEYDYRRTFNLGIGMILAVSRRQLKAAEKILDRLGEKYFEIGRVVESPGSLVIYK